MNALKKIFCRWLTAIASGAILALCLVATASAQEEPPTLVTNPPLVGTFYLMHQQNGPPYPFDPYAGLLPVYEWKPSVYLIDDVEFVSMMFSEGGGGMSLMSGTGPGGFPVGDGTNGGSAILICSASTNFTLTYRYWTNDLALGVALGTNGTIDLTVLTSTTNALYDLFGTTNLNSLALPQLSRTNWQWLFRTENSSISFTWGDTNWCAAWFQLGTMLDTDGDLLTDAYESLTSHTRPSGTNSWDTDGDGVGDGVEVWQGRNPLGGVIADTNNILSLQVFTPLK